MKRISRIQTRHVCLKQTITLKKTMTKTIVSTMQYRSRLQRKLILKSIECSFPTFALIICLTVKVLRFERVKGR